MAAETAPPPGGQKGALPAIAPLTAEQPEQPLKGKQIAPPEEAPAPASSLDEQASSGAAEAAATSPDQSASSPTIQDKPETIAAITPPATGAAAEKKVDLARGEELYKSACVACHLTGIAGAPKLSDKKAWMPRLNQSFETLVEHAIKGYRAMPPKGGRLDIPDEDVMSAVGYMMSKVK
jgi:cytochrome c5